MQLTDKIDLYNEDNMTGMARYPDKYFSIAIIDPPYGIGESLKKRENTVSNKWKRPTQKKHNIKGWDTTAPDSGFFKELFRVSEQQIIWGANHFISRIAIDSPGWIVWDKKNGESDFSDCELAWTSFDKGVRKFEWLWNGFQKQQPEERIHPTQKPVALYKWLLERYAKPDFKILDTHCGSFSIGIAAHQYGCHLTGFELDPEYYEASIHRFKMQTNAEYAVNHKVKTTGQHDLFI